MILLADLELTKKEADWIGNKRTRVTTITKKQ
jgi:tRNA (guanine37-N1)-methyltransferase